LGDRCRKKPRRRDRVGSAARTTRLAFLAVRRAWAAEAEARPAEVSFGVAEPCTQQPQRGFAVKPEDDRWSSSVYTAADLARAEAHVDTAVRRVEEQRERIARLAADGHDTRDAEALLPAMVNLLGEMKRYR